MTATKAEDMPGRGVSCHHRSLPQAGAEGTSDLDRMRDAGLGPRARVTPLHAGVASQEEDAGRIGLKVTLVYVESGGEACCLPYCPTCPGHPGGISLCAF